MCRANPTGVRQLVAFLLVAGTVARAWAQPVPPDVVDSWAGPWIRHLLERRVVDTDPDGLFRPQAPLSRARFVRWLVAARGLPLVQPERSAYSDLSPVDPAAPAVEAAARYGLLPEGPSFRPHQLLRRADAVEWVVRAMGYGWEAGWLGSRLDPAGAEFAAMLVAVRTDPPLLQEPYSELRPHDPITRAEAASLLWAYLKAVEEGVRLRHEQALAPGLVLVAEKRGALKALPVWRVQVGAFSNPDNAHRLAARMRAGGVASFVDEVDGLYKVRVGAFATRQEAQELARRLQQDGLPTWVVSTVRDLERLPVPQWVAAVRVDLQAFEVRPVLARDRVLGRERTSEMARRVGALAAINGGFFAPDGDPLGGLIIDGEWVSEPMAGRTCLGLGDGFALVDTLDWWGEVATPGGPVRVAGINRARRPGEVVVYTPRYAEATPPGGTGVEVVVVGGVVREVRAAGNNQIPRDGFVVSAGGSSVATLQALRPGDPVRLWLSLQPATGDARWQQVRHVTCGGPRLVLAGSARPADEGFPEGFRSRRHPRAAAGVTSDGRLLLVVADGRWPEHALGMTLEELARELVGLGATDAVNLDGGGSATLVVGGTLANRPSDEGGERPVSDALVVKPRTGARRGP